MEYGRSVSIDDAAFVPRDLTAVCKDLRIPIGYETEPGYHGSDKGMTDFYPWPSDGKWSTVRDYATCYLHPHFLKGDEGKAFVSLLKELKSTDRWDDIAVHLRDGVPIYMKDLEAARERFISVPTKDCAQNPAEKESVLAQIKQGKEAQAAAPKKTKKQTHSGPDL